MDAMEALGWISFTLIGAWGSFIAVLWILIRRTEGKGIGPVITGFYGAAFSAAAWIVFAVWLSPLTLAWATRP